MITINNRPEYVFYVGTTFTVEWYVNRNGRMNAKDYYDNLPEEEKNRLGYIVKYIADSPIGTRLHHRVYNLENAEHKIYAFKPQKHRFFNFMSTDRKIIILDAYRKHSQQMTKKDLNQLKTVIDAKNDYNKCTKEGTYYERFT